MIQFTDVLTRRNKHTHTHTHTHTNLHTHMTVRSPACIFVLVCFIAAMFSDLWKRSVPVYGRIGSCCRAVFAALAVSVDGPGPDGAVGGRCLLVCKGGNVWGALVGWEPIRVLYLPFDKHTFLTFNISCGTCGACVSEGILPWNSASCCAFVRLRPDVVRLSITLETATLDQLSLSWACPSHLKLPLWINCRSARLGFPGHIFAPCDEGKMRVPGLGQITWPPDPMNDMFPYW